MNVQDWKEILSECGLHANNWGGHFYYGKDSHNSVHFWSDYMLTFITIDKLSLNEI